MVFQLSPTLIYLTTSPSSFNTDYSEYDALVKEVSAGNVLSEEAVEILATLSKAETACNKLPQTISGNPQKEGICLFASAVTMWNEMTQSLPSALSDVIVRLKGHKLAQPKLLQGTVRTSFLYKMK